MSDESQTRSPREQEKYDRWFRVKENDAWVIKGMLAAGGTTAMIAEVFAVDEQDIIDIQQGNAWQEPAYPGELPF